MPRSLVVMIFSGVLMLEAQDMDQQLAGAMQDTSRHGYRDSWGLDILISTGGVGLGGFYRHEFTKDVSGFVALSVSESKDEREFEFFNYYTQTYFSPGKINRFLIIPLVVGVQHRLFSEAILDNFRPYLTAAVGPTMIYTTPYEEEFFAALGKGRPRYTIGGYVGAGAFFGADKSNVFGLSIRYYFVPFAGGIESLQALAPPPPPPQGLEPVRKKEFGGFFITFNLGNAW